MQTQYKIKSTPTQKILSKVKKSWDREKEQTKKKRICGCSWFGFQVILIWFWLIWMQVLCCCCFKLFLLLLQVGKKMKNRSTEAHGKLNSFFNRNLNEAHSLWFRRTLHFIFFLATTKNTNLLLNDCFRFFFHLMYIVSFFFFLLLLLFRCLFFRLPFDLKLNRLSA